MFLIFLSLLSTVKLQHCILPPSFCVNLPNYIHLDYGPDAIHQTFKAVPATCYFRNMLACKVYNPCVMIEAYELYRKTGMKEFEPLRDKLAAGAYKDENFMAALWGFCDDALTEEYEKAVPLTHVMGCPLVPETVTAPTVVALALALGKKSKCSVCEIELRALDLVTQALLANAIIQAGLCPEICKALLDKNTVFPVNDYTMEQVKHVCSSATLEARYNVTNALSVVKEISLMPGLQKANALSALGIYNPKAKCFPAQLKTCVDVLLTDRPGTNGTIRCVADLGLARLNESTTCSGFYPIVLKHLGLGDLIKKVDETHDLCWL